MAATLMLKFIGGVTTTTQSAGRFVVGLVPTGFDGHRNVEVLPRTSNPTMLRRMVARELSSKLAGDNGPWSGRTGDGMTLSVIDSHRGNRVVHLGAILSGSDPATTTAIKVVGGRPRAADRLGRADWTA